MNNRMLSLILAACMLLAVVSPVAFASETEETTAATEETAEETTEATEETEPEKDASATSGDCGGDISWSLEGSTLTISGTGDMDAGCPWEAHKEKIKSVVFTGGVTMVGAGAFRDFDEITSVEFGSSMREIGAQAFLDCDGLQSIRMPATFRRFGEESFRDCGSLKDIYCVGPMPSFRANCLWTGNHITIHTPTNNPWPQDEVEKLVNNFGGRLEVVNDNGELVYEYTEPTEAPETTEPTTEATTEPVTEETTQVTETTEAPETTVETEPETTASAEQTETAAEDEEETVVEKAGANGWIWIVIVAAVLTGLLVLAMVVRSISHKGGKYSA